MINGYKVFNSDWTCRGFQYEVGQIYEHEGEISPCKSGFHFCKKAADCFGYYNFDSNNKVAEVEALGDIKTDGDKSVTNKIKIVRELSWNEVLEIVNIGKDNTGLKNSGDWNSGNFNRGSCNSGNWNSGDFNSGNLNSGDCNSGDCNSGGFNSGNCNSGGFNSGDYNSGFFCTITPKPMIFNKPTEYTRSAICHMPGMYAIRKYFNLNKWIVLSDMTDQEKSDHPECETFGGYLKTYGYKEAWKNTWDEMTESDRESVKALPNFDPDIFYDITGIIV